MSTNKGGENGRSFSEPNIFTIGITNPAFQNTDVNQLGNATVTIRDPAQNHKAQKHQTSDVDSGYAWVVLMACCGSRALQSISEAIMGVLLIELQHIFQASTVELVTASTTQFGISLCACVITGLPVSMFGTRTTHIAGALITTAGFIATSFAPNIYVFIFTYGVLSAFGNSCMIMGSLVPLGQYFQKHKAVAVSLYMSGYTLGYFVWPPVVIILFNQYGWRGSFLILAGVQLNGCVLGALIRPFKEDKGKAHIEAKKTSACSQLLSQRKVFANKHFMLYCGVQLLVNTGYSFGPAYLPTMAEGFGASETSAALLVTVFGISNWVSRVMHGFIGDAPWFRDNRLILCVYSCVLAGVNKIWSIRASTYAHLTAFATIDGFSNGAFTGLLFTITTDLVQPHQHALSGGLIALTCGTAILAGNSSSGWMYAHYGNLKVPALALGSIQIIAALMMFCLYLHVRLKSKNVYSITLPINVSVR